MAIVFVTDLFDTADGYFNVNTFVCVPTHVQTNRVLVVSYACGTRQYESIKFYALNLIIILYAQFSV